MELWWLSLVMLHYLHTQKHKLEFDWQDDSLNAKYVFHSQLLPITILLTNEYRLTCQFTTSLQFTTENGNMTVNQTTLSSVIRRRRWLRCSSAGIGSILLAAMLAQFPPCRHQWLMLDASASPNHSVTTAACNSTAIKVRTSWNPSLRSLRRDHVWNATYGAQQQTL